MWLAPCQVKIIPFSEAQKEYAQSIYKKLLIEGIRVDYDDSYSDPLSAKIQRAIEARDFLSIIVGQKEVESGTLSLRYNYTNKRDSNRTLLSIIEEIKAMYPSFDYTF